MKRSHANAGRSIALGLAFMLAGCSDFSQHHIGGVRRLDNVAGAPKATPTLQIANPPAAVASALQDGNFKQATFVPDREPPAPSPSQPSQPPLRVLYQRASDRLATMDSYVFRLRRRESVAGKKMPEELIRVQLRKDPYSVHLKWLGAEGKGRETIYVKGKYDNNMQILLAANDAFPFSPAGLRWSIAPDDARAKARSRYPITNTGLNSVVERFGRLVTSTEKGDTSGGTLKYLGKLKRLEFDAPVEGALQVLAPTNDPSLPKGGQRWWFFDATTGLPVLIVAHDPDGEVEYYCHDHFQGPARLDDDDFNPDRVWRK